MCTHALVRLNTQRRAVHIAAIYIDITPNRQSPPAVLLRGAHREGRLHKITAQAARRTNKPMITDEIGVKIGKIIDRHKKSAQQTDDDQFADSLETLLADLDTRCKNTCRAGEGKTAIRFQRVTESPPSKNTPFACSDASNDRLCPVPLHLESNLTYCSVRTYL